VTDILTDAQAWIYQRLRVREMRSSVQVPITLGQAYTTIPTGFLDPVKMMMRDPPLRIFAMTEEQLMENRIWEDATTLSDGTPTRYAVFDEAFNWEVLPDANYTCDLVYYKIPASLSALNPTNWLTNRYPLLLRTLCMGFAASYMKDYTEMKTQLGIADNMIDDIRVQDDLSRRGSFTDDP
jgi:hypothetical protein